MDSDPPIQAFSEYSNYFPSECNEFQLHKQGYRI